MLNKKTNFGKVIIDAHLHIGLKAWTEEYLIKYLDNNQIEKAWILTWEENDPIVPGYYIPLDLEMVKKAYKNHPDRIVPFYAPDPGRPSWKEDLQSCLDEGFAGCAELKVSYRWDDPKVIALLEFLDQKKLPLIFHMERGRNIFVPKKERGLDWLMKRLINERYNGKPAHMIENLGKKTGFLKKYLSKRLVEFPGYLLDFDALEKAISTYPGITFIGHGPHIWNNYSVPEKHYLFHQKEKFHGPGILWRLLEEYPNFYCDISGFSGFNAMNRNHAASKLFLTTFSHKILFGTDNNELGLYPLLESLDIELDKREQIYSKNALSILGS